MSTISKHLGRGIEKVPGVNLLQVAYFGDQKILMFPKVGTRSIRDAVLAYHKLGQDRNAAWTNMAYHGRSWFHGEGNTSDCLVVARDPLARLHSCWKQKVGRERENAIFYFFQYYPLIRPDMSFMDFLKAVRRIPIALREKHFIPMGYFLQHVEAPAFRIISLRELDGVLAALLGRTVPPKRANQTAPREITEDEREYFDRHLADDYRYDLDIGSQLEARL